MLIICEDAFRAPSMLSFEINTNEIAVRLEKKSRWGFILDLE